MNSHLLPKSLVVVVCVLSLVPFITGLIGNDIDAEQDSETSYENIPVQLRDHIQDDPTIESYYMLRGPFFYTVLEWTASCVAFFTGLLSLVHYRLKKDVTTPIIGTAMLFTGLLDAFNILAADRLTFPVVDLDRFIPMSWAIARTFNVAILFAGALPFLYRKNPKFIETPPQETRYLILLGVLFSVSAFAITQIQAVVVPLPEALYPELTVRRPWDMVPLVLWLITGLIILPRFWKLYPSLFSYSLLLCSVPAVMSELHVSLGSKELYDYHFFSACFLKILAYSIPLTGLMLDYINAYRAELELQKTESKLKAARQIQRSLLPSDAPDFKGLDAAGFSYSSDAVGGDYYDFIKIADERVGVVVGDVSGHDLAASLLISQTRAYLRAFFSTVEDLGEIMTRLNNALIADTQYRRFVTMFAATIDSDRKGFSFAAAGHQGYILKKDGSTRILDATFLPLGMNRNESVKIARIDDIQSGDMLLVVTDGITEALSPQKEQYGIERLLEFIHINSEQNVRELVQMLHDDVDRFCAGSSPSDDVTVVLIRWK